MVILAGTIRVASGTQSAATKVLARLVEATRAEEGCISYSFAFDVLDDRLLRIFEVFRDQAALATHWASPHMAAWKAEAAELGVADREIWQYEVTSGKQI